MTQQEFEALPALLSRAQVKMFGVKDHVIDQIRIEVTDDSTVQVGRIGAIRLHGGYWKYRKCDVGRMCGFSKILPHGATNHERRHK